MTGKIRLELVSGNKKKSLIPKQRQHLLCDSRRNTIPQCYQTEKWLGVELEDFMACETNMAFNRQTRMIADLEVNFLLEKTKPKS